MGWLGSRTDALNHFPAYVRNNPAWLYETPYAIAWKRWNESAMTAYIDMLAAYAKEFDDEPYFEEYFRSVKRHHNGQGRRLRQITVTLDTTHNLEGWQNAHRKYSLSQMFGYP